ncbi:MAG: helix-turn-helix transcriptional regulator [Clostridia bacterium]|nr:helix-turn-helix transcriptional regulator [Clostridia bacterium]
MFGERLKALRLAKGLSQEELGKRLGVSKQTVSNWEIENVTPALDMFINVVNYFHTTPNYMLGYEVYAGLDVTGLTEKEVSHVMLLIDDLKAHHQKDK